LLYDGKISSVRSLESCQSLLKAELTLRAKSRRSEFNES